MATAFLARVFSQELARRGIEDANKHLVPLGVDFLSNAAWRQAVVGGLHLDAAVWMHHPRAVLVITERFERQWKQTRFFFGEHGGHLAFGGAMNASIGAAGFPAVEIGLAVVQSLKALSFQRRSLGMTDTGFDFSLAIGVFDSTGQSYNPIMGEHIAVERVESGVVDIGDEHTFFQIVEHDDAWTAT